MLQKMWHKRWMNLCLLLGITLLVATLVSFPLYEHAAYDRMLQDEFETYLANEGKWPTSNTMVTFSKRDKKGTTIEKMEKFVAELADTLGVTETQSIACYSLTASDIHSEMNRPDLSGKFLKLASMSDLENHAEIRYGESFSDTGITEDGAIEVLVEESCLVEKGLLIGETIIMDTILDSEGNPFRVKIKGVFDTSRNEDFYWQIDKLELIGSCFMKEDLFRQIFLGERVGKYNITCTYFQLFSYQDISYEQVSALNETTRYMTEKSAYRSVFRNPPYQEILEEYQSKQTRIAGTLRILQIPVLIMLAAFLIMISNQMYELEKNEISVIKSRGSYRRQIFLLYLYQNLLLTAVGGLAGTGLGRLFASVLGATRNFLSFSGESAFSVSFHRQGFLFALAGMIFSLICLTLPAISHSGITIVNLKQKKNAGRKPLWQKLFLDVILLGVALYGYYSFHKDLTSISNTVLSGESLDPLLYISSALFILGAGLLYLRLQPWLVQLIYLTGKKHWGPAGYISFMENRKNGRKQQMIMLFLIMTISLGMYHAIVARTILDNALENREYLDGADVVLMEKWEQIRDADGIATGAYREPDYQKYMTADFVKDCTRVYYDDDAYYSENKNDRQTITVMGIHTREFGSLTSLSDTLNEKSYHTYLNELARSADGVLVSSNFRTKYGLEIGDTIYYRSSGGTQASGKIVDFVDYWPGFATSRSSLKADGTAYTEEGYLIVTHFELLRKAWQGLPYEVWMTTKDGYDSGDVYDFIEDHKIQIKKYVNKSQDIRSVLEDPLLQGTNGVLTLGFVVTILLCVIGYLIYWIMSVKERELVFGVLRACGFHREELISMLFSEQLFAGLFSCLAGALIGGLTSRLYIPILQYAYASADQSLPMRMIVDRMDMLRLYGVIACAMMICLVVLIWILQRMNITKALKLGEE